MQKNFQRIILGATSAGLGAFFADPEETLLIEASSMIGTDFATCFYPGSTTGNQLNTNDSHIIFEEASKIGVLKNGFVHLPGLHTLLYKYLSPFVQNCLLLTEYLSAETIDGKFAVTVFNKNGTTVYTCDELIDATPTLVTNQIKTEVVSGSLGSVFVSTKDDAVLLVLKHGKVFPTCFSNEFYFHIPLTREDSWANARNNLIKFIIENKEAFEGWSLAATAVEKKIKISDKYKGLASVLNSSAFDGIVEGFNGGIQFINNRKALV
jgi:hypothetical protein